MPLVRIDLPTGKSPEERRAIGDVVYDALLAIDVPRDDRFQIITEHGADGLLFDRTYLGIDRSDACLFIQITLNEGRSLAQKRLLYRRLADGLHERAGMRREHVCVNLVEVNKANWSYGNGEAQYAAGSTT